MAAWPAYGGERHHRGMPGALKADKENSNAACVKRPCLRRPVIKLAVALSCKWRMKSINEKAYGYLWPAATSHGILLAMLAAAERASGTLHKWRLYIKRASWRHICLMFTSARKVSILRSARATGAASAAFKKIVE